MYVFSVHQYDAEIFYILEITFLFLVHFRIIGMIFLLLM